MASGERVYPQTEPFCMVGVQLLRITTMKRTIKGRVQSIGIWSYALIWTIYAAFALISLEFLPAGIGVLLAWPAWRFLNGWPPGRRWVGGFSIFLLPLMVLLPMMQHEIDRTLGFWAFWTTVLAILSINSITAWFQPDPVGQTSSGDVD